MNLQTEPWAITMKNRYKLIPEVFIMLIRDGKILLSRRFQTGYEDGNYGLPGGHGEEGETMSEGIIREVMEELGIEIDKADCRFVLAQHRWCPDVGNPHARVGFYFAPSRWVGEPVNKEPNKCDDLQWFPLDALPTNTIGHIRNAIESYRNNISYSEYDWESR